LAGGLAGGLTPFLIGALVWGLILSLAGTTGSSMNPARDLSSRIAHAILPIAGKGSSDWAYAPISVLGTLIGGALAGLAIRFLHI
jgi:glycerol uptake facilitator protein